MNRIKTMWNCAICEKSMEVGHREYRDLECCGTVAPKEFVPISEAEYQGLLKDGCYNLEAEIDCQRYARRAGRMSRKEIM